jgi:hypothetical protein
LVDVRYAPAATKFRRAAKWRDVPTAVISTGVRGRFWRFEDVSVGTEEVSSSFTQALELAMPLVQIVSRNVFLASNEIPNTLC